MRNVIIVGLNPTKLPIPRKGGAMHRFREWLDYLGINQVAFTNLSSDPFWDKKQVDIDYLKSSMTGHTKVVAWGPAVSKHLSVAGIEHFTLPHPSPLNRQINDHKFIRQKLDECKEFLNED